MPFGALNCTWCVPTDCPQLFLFKKDDAGNLGQQCASAQLADDILKHRPKTFCAVVGVAMSEEYYRDTPDMEDSIELVQCGWLKRCLQRPRRETALMPEL